MGDDWHIWKVPHFLATTSYGAIGGLSGFVGTGDPYYGVVAGLGLWIGHILGLHASAGMGWTTKSITQLDFFDKLDRVNHPKRFMDEGNGTIAVWNPEDLVV